MGIFNIILRNSLITRGAYLNNFSKFSCYSFSNYTSGLKSSKFLNSKNNSIINFSSKNMDGALKLYPRDKSILFRRYTTETGQSPNSEQAPKKMSKFKQFYSQYGPTFLVVHLTTVVLWIYGFFLISKQGYDITQILNLFHKMNIMAESTVKSIHEKIDNYKPKNGWVTGTDIKHFATAYMVYKVIAPFRYMVSIGIVRVLVRNLRARGLMKS